MKPRLNNSTTRTPISSLLGCKTRRLCSQSHTQKINLREPAKKGKKPAAQRQYKHKRNLSTTIHMFNLLPRTDESLYKQLFENTKEGNQSERSGRHAKHTSISSLQSLGGSRMLAPAAKGHPERRSFNKT